MVSDFESFKQDLNLTKIEICRELYRQNLDTIRIKKEHVAVKNLSRIIDSTLRLAGTKGFQAMSLRDLCADSKFSIGGLYAYIRNKGDLLYLIQSHGFILTRRTLLRYTSDIESPREKLFGAIKAHLYLSELMLPWFYFSFMEAKNLPPKEKKEAIAIEQEIEDIFYDILQAGITSGVFRKTDARLSASMIKAMMQDWYLKRRKYEKQQVNVMDYAQFVCGMLDKHLEAPGRADHPASPAN